MTTPMPTASFAEPATRRAAGGAAAALTAHGFAVEILDDASAARARVQELVPEGATVFTGASETLRLSGIEEDLNASGRYDAAQVAQSDHGPRHPAGRDLAAAVAAPTSSWAASTRSPRPARW